MTNEFKRNNMKEMEGIYMFNEERKNKIMALLEQEDKVTVGDLSARFDVSDVTIRKDLRELCDVGLAVRTHGGAMKRNQTRFELNQEQKAQEAHAEKQAIAAYAVEEIRDGETIMLYGGSTTQALARCIKQGKWMDLTVVTNALNIANELADVDGLGLILIGGMMRKRMLTCIGPLTEDTLKQLVVDRVFVSVNCVSLEYGLTASSIEEGRCVRSMLDSGLRKYLLSHSGKFGGNAVYRVCGLEDVHVVITDSDLPHELADGVRKKKCELIQV